MGEIRECPFCGGGRLTRIVAEVDEWTRCNECLAEGPCVNDGAGDVAWNARPTEDALRAEVERAQARATAYANLLRSFRYAINTVTDELEDEGDRVYLGSTNDADTLRDQASLLEDIEWGAMEPDFGKEDFLASARKANLENTELRAESERLRGLVREAAGFISEDREALFSGHQINGSIRIEDEADESAAKSVASMDDWLSRAALQPKGDGG